MPCAATLHSSGASLLFQNVPQFGDSCGFKGAEEPTWDTKTAITTVQAKARLSEGLAVTCSPLWSLLVPWGHSVLPAPNPTLADVPSAGHSAISWWQSWRLHFQHHLLFLQLFIAIMLVIHTSGAALHCIQMSANTLPGQILILAANIPLWTEALFVFLLNSTAKQIAGLGS